jgi:thiol-disulfide isomerase/thioredoxin
MKLIQFSIAAILLLSYQITAQNTKFQMGEKVPDIKFSHCINATLDSNFYKGKTVVLEFWATWCAPCIAGFPHINELSDKFSSSDVLFLSLTREKEIDKIKSVLAKRPLKAFNLIDKNNITSKQYGVEALPQTFVIGKNGSLLWNGYYSDLTSGMLKKLIETQTPILISENQKSSNTVAADRFFLKVNYSGNQEVNGFGESLTNTDFDNYGRFGWECKEWSFTNFLGGQLSGFLPLRIKSNQPDFNIDLQFFCDTTLLARPSEFLRVSLCNLFNLQTKREVRDTMVWSVEVVDKNKLMNAKSLGTHSSTAVKKEFIFLNQPFKNICSFFEIRMKDFFEFDKSLLGKLKFDVNIPFATTVAEVNKSLLDKYGFHFIQQKKQIEILNMLFN